MCFKANNTQQHSAYTNILVGMYLNTFLVQKKKHLKGKNTNEHIYTKYFMKTNHLCLHSFLLHFSA